MAEIHLAEILKAPNERSSVPLGERGEDISDKQMAAKDRQKEVVQERVELAVDDAITAISEASSINQDKEMLRKKMEVAVRGIKMLEADNPERAEELMKKLRDSVKDDRNIGPWREEIWPRE